MHGTEFLSRTRGFVISNKQFLKNIDMNKDHSELVATVLAMGRNALTARDYKAGSLAQRIAYSGIDASELAAADRSRPEVKRAWIPGVEVFARQIHPQPHRGSFGELGRRDEGLLAKIGFWPNNGRPRACLRRARRVFMSITERSIRYDSREMAPTIIDTMPRNYSLRRYDQEQWDVMFFLQGRAEMFLCDVRAGLSGRIMRFFVDGDNHRGSNNVGVVIPPGVAHAIRVEGAEDVIMVYGTSTIFHPEFEGRIASEIESADLPESWQKFLGRGD